MIDPYGEYAVLVGANSEGGQRMLARGHRLRVGQEGMVGYVTGRGQARIAVDVGHDIVFFNNPDLPETRSEITLPLKVGDHLFGALDVQSTLPGAFDTSDIALLSTLANQVASAIENTRLVNEAQRSVRELELSQRLFIQQEWSKLIEEHTPEGFQYILGKLVPLSSKDTEGAGIIPKAVLSRYFAEIRVYPLLTKEEEMRLARRVKSGRQEALHELIESNLSFVVKVASEYRNLGLPFEDLLNEGNIGLIEAARRYDASKGTKFITYAIWWIRKSILKALSEHTSLVRVPNYQMKKVREIREAETSLRRSLGRVPERTEISERLPKSVTKIDQTLQSSVREVSLDDKAGREKDKSIADYLIGRGILNRTKAR